MNLFGKLVVHFGRGISPTQGFYLHKTTQQRKTSRHASMPWAGFETTIPVFERSKRVRSLNRATIGTG